MMPDSLREMQVITIRVRDYQSILLNLNFTGLL